MLLKTTSPRLSRVATAVDLAVLDVFVVVLLVEVELVLLAVALVEE